MLEQHLLVVLIIKWNELLSQAYFNVTICSEVSLYYYKLRLSSNTDCSPHHDSTLVTGSLNCGVEKPLPDTSVNSLTSIMAFKDESGFIRKYYLLPLSEDPSPVMQCPVQSCLDMLWFQIQPLSCPSTNDSICFKPATYRVSANGHMESTYCVRSSVKPIPYPLDTEFLFAHHQQV